MKTNARPAWVSFSVTGRDLSDLQRLARRLGYPSVEPFAVEVFKVGLQTLEDRYEPIRTTTGRTAAAARVDAWGDRSARAGRRRTQRAAMPPDHERRRDRLLGGG